MIGGNGDVAEFYQASLAGQLQSLHEKRVERIEMLLAKVGDGVVIRMLIGGEEAECEVVVGGFLYAS